MKLVALFGIFVAVVVGGVCGDGMEEVFRWKQVDYHDRGDDEPSDKAALTSTFKPGAIIFPDQYERIRSKRATRVSTSRDPIDLSTRWRAPAENTQTNTSSYIPYNNVPMGATHYKGRLFVTMPRRREGIPSTLNYIDMRRDGRTPSPKLHAYPNFETNYLSPEKQASPNRILSVYRTTVDECQRLWFIDTGVLEYPDNQMQLQQPSIWIMDLKSDRLLHRFEIPESIVDRGNGLASITIDVTSGNCSDAFAYIPDLLHYQLYVFSLGQNDIWAIHHNYFNFDPLAGDLTIGGESFRWNDGIFSMTLGPRDPTGYRNAYFHAMASTNEFYVSTEVLQNREAAENAGDGVEFKSLGSRGEARQSTMHEYDPRTGVIFYNEIQRNGIGCWNTKQPFSPENHGTVAQDPERMIYPSDLTIDEDGTIWMMTNSMPIFIYSNLDTNIYNFRVWKQNVNTAIQNTQCSRKAHKW